MSIRKLIVSKKGFTLIELMIVVAIIGILAAIAIPQFAQLIAKSQEGAAKGNLGSVRSALSIYYGDTEGYYPQDLLTSLTTSGKYLSTIPSASLPKTSLSTGHPNPTTTPVAGVDLATTGPGDVGGWAYDNKGASSQNWGQVLLACTHTDVRGTAWTAL